MLTADAVLTQTFTATKFRQGYDVLQVDDFLDRVIAAFRYYETGGAQGSRMLSSEVRSMKFPVTKFREGYDLTGVDDFLDEVEQSLAHLEKSLAAGAPQPLRQYAEPQYAQAAQAPDPRLLPPMSPHAREEYPAQSALDLTTLVNELQRTYLLSNVPSSSTPIVLTPDGRQYVVRAITHESGQVVLEIG